MVKVNTTTTQRLSQVQAAFPLSVASKRFSFLILFLFISLILRVHKPISFTICVPIKMQLTVILENSILSESILDAHKE